MQDSRPPVGLPDQNDRAFSIEEARAFHQRFEPEFGTWNVGGDFSRYVYLHVSEFWTCAVLNRSDSVRELPQAVRKDLAEFSVSSITGQSSFFAYITNSPTDGVIVVQGGQILFEHYPRMRRHDRHLWYSLSKPVVATAVAILEDRRQIDSGNPIVHYLEELAGTAWEGVPIIDILDMASGIDCPETINDPQSIFWKFYDAFGWPRTDRMSRHMVDVLRQMGTCRPPGEAFEYTSVNTEILCWLVEMVAKERYQDFVEREIWKKAGTAFDGYLVTTPRGNAFSAGGFSSTLRDLARFGLLFTPSGRRGPAPVVSDEYLAKIQYGGRPGISAGLEEEWRHALGRESFHHSTYQWNIVTAKGDFYKEGTSGQGLLVSPEKDLVIAWFGTRDEQQGDNEMRSIAGQLLHSELFNH